ncbi:MAG: hypothetical protein AAFY60_02820, partial [Myxococcota bacterium]
KFSNFLDDLGPEGALGSSNKGRNISTQVNIGIDTSDAVFMKELLANYNRNAAPIRLDIQPTLSRRFYIQRPASTGIERIDDPNWKPTQGELLDWYEEFNHPKWSSLQLFSDLLMDKENFARAKQPTVTKDSPARPVAEFREADTVMSDDAQPTRMSKSLMREVQFAIALVHATEQGHRLDAETEVRRHLGDLDQIGSVQRPVNSSAVGMSAPTVANLLGLDGRELGVTASAMVAGQLPGGSVSYWAAQEGGRLLARLEHEGLLVRDDAKGTSLSDMLSPVSVGGMEPRRCTLALNEQSGQIRNRLLERIAEHSEGIGHGHRLNATEVFDRAFREESERQTALRAELTKPAD